MSTLQAGLTFFLKSLTAVELPHSTVVDTG